MSQLLKIPTIRSSAVHSSYVGLQQFQLHQSVDLLRSAAMVHSQCQDIAGDSSIATLLQCTADEYLFLSENLPAQAKLIPGPMLGSTREVGYTQLPIGKCRLSKHLGLI